MHHLEKSEARAVFEQVRADTASLTVGNKDLEDAVSVMSGYTPSVNFEIDNILMAHPAYQAAYGNVCSPPSDLFRPADICSAVPPFHLAHRKTRLRTINLQVRRKLRPRYSINHAMSLRTTQSTHYWIRQIAHSRNHNSKNHLCHRREGLRQKSPPTPSRPLIPTRIFHPVLHLLR